MSCPGPWPACPQRMSSTSADVLPSGSASATLSVSHVWLQKKQAGEVFRGGGGNFLPVQAQKFRQDLGGFYDHGRLIAFAAMRRRRQPRRIRLHQQTVERNAPGHV